MPVARGRPEYTSTTNSSSVSPSDDSASEEPLNGLESRKQLRNVSAAPDELCAHDAFDIDGPTQGGKCEKDPDSQMAKEGDPCLGWCKDSNFRDIASADGPCNLRQGRVYRCSQFHTAELRDYLKIKTILDLRKSEKPCSKLGKKARELHPESIMVRAQNMSSNSVAPRCPICESHLNKDADGAGVEVYHIDFCTREFKLKVFTSIPFSSAAYAAGKVLMGYSPDGDMAGVVADPGKLGYGKLYILFLEHAKPMIARAFRLMGKEENYPMMVHCIHGKDRTGILVMLILRTCGAEFQQILNEYMNSSETMAFWAGNRPDLDEKLSTRTVLSVERAYMAQAIEHIVDKYGDVSAYLETCGVDASVQDAVRHNLMQRPEEAKPTAPSGRHASSLSAPVHSLPHVERRNGVNAGSRNSLDAVR